LASEFEYFRTEICPGYYADLNLAQKEIDSTNQSLVSAGFLKMMSTTIHTTYVAPG